MDDFRLDWSVNDGFGYSFRMSIDRVLVMGNNWCVVMNRWWSSHDRRVNNFVHNWGCLRMGIMITMVEVVMVMFLWGTLSMDNWCGWMISNFGCNLLFVVS